MTDSWETRLLVGIGEYLAGQGVVLWGGAGALPAPDETRPVLIAGPLPASPDWMVGMTLYGGSDDPDTADVLQPVQFWARGTAGDPETVRLVTDALFGALHAAEDLDLGGVPVSLALRNSALPMGEDAQGRPEASHNYYLYALRPTASRTD